MLEVQPDIITCNATVSTGKEAQPDVITYNVTVSTCKRYSPTSLPTMQRLQDSAGKQEVEVRSAR